MATKTWTGARCVFLHNGVPIAYAAGVDASEEIMYEPVDVLDNLLTVEHAPTGVRVTLSARFFRTVALGASSSKSPGSLKAQGIFLKLKDILASDGLDVVLQDSYTKQTLEMFQKVKSASRNFSVQARGIVATNCTFVTTRVLDESELSDAAAA